MKEHVREAYRDGVSARSRVKARQGREVTLPSGRHREELGKLVLI